MSTTSAVALRSSIAILQCPIFQLETSMALTQIYIKNLQITKIASNLGGSLLLTLSTKLNNQNYKPSYSIDHHNQFLKKKPPKFQFKNYSPAFFKTLSTTPSHITYDYWNISCRHHDPSNKNHNTPHEYQGTKISNTSTVVPYPRSSLARNNSKNRSQNFWEIIFFQKIIFWTVKKKILKNIPKIWHLSKGDLPKK
jgi:hypothetical protein